MFNYYWAMRLMTDFQNCGKVKQACGLSSFVHICQKQNNATRVHTQKEMILASKGSSPLVEGSFSWQSIGAISLALLMLSLALVSFSTTLARLYLPHLTVALSLPNNPSCISILFKMGHGTKPCTASHLWNLLSGGLRKASLAVISVLTCCI